jgi:pyruvate/2-oxoglutarate dehydrogenase complex dihydrolipoamide dehydrogenase (E3) component
VIVGGYIGLELAQAVRRFGSEVTVIERGAQLAEREDPDVGAALLDLFHDEGIEVLLGTQVSQVEGHSGKKVRVYAKDGPGERIVEGTDLLVSVGRTPNTKGIGLEQFGVELDARPYIKVNDRLETTASNVWAMGDCADSPQFTHVAYHDFRVVRHNLKGGNRTTKDRIVPFCMFTDPELARVGRNETEVKRDKIGYRVAKLPMANVLRTHTIAEPRGFMKMLIGKASDEIVGFTAFGIEASELMAAVQTAMVGRLPYTVLRDAIFAHPTMSEGWSSFSNKSRNPRANRTRIACRRAKHQRIERVKENRRLNNPSLLVQVHAYTTQNLNRTINRSLAAECIARRHHLVLDNL